MRFELDDELLPRGVIATDDTWNVACEGCKAGVAQFGVITLEKTSYRGIPSRGR